MQSIGRFSSRFAAGNQIYFLFSHFNFWLNHSERRSEASTVADEISKIDGDLRHFRIVPATLLQNGVQLGEVRKATGHRNPGTTKPHGSRFYYPEKTAN